VGALGAFSGTLASGLVPNTLYYYQAYATNSVGTGYGAALGFLTLPSAPVVGTASGVGATSFSANWTAPAAPFGPAAFTYTLEVDDANDFATPVQTLADIASGTTSLLLTGLSPSTDYYYRIKAVNGTGSSVWSSPSAPVTTHANEIGLATAGAAVTQNFDSLAASGTSGITPEGWLFSEAGSGANNTYAATDGTGTNVSGNTFSLGLDGNSDRAFGGLQSSSLTPTIGARLKNNTGTTITALQISFTGETWRVGTASRTDQLDFQYSTDATSLATGTWTNVNELDYANPSNLPAGSGSLQHSAAISHTITGLSLAPGATLYIRWSDFSASGADDAMGIDDFSVTPLESVSSAPEIALSTDGIPLSNGGTDDVGNQDVGATIGITYDMVNNGDADLTLGSVSVNGSTNATASVITQPGTTVLPAGSTSAVIDVTPTAPGPWTVSLSVTTNDSDENPTTWTIAGNGRSTSPVSLSTLGVAVTQNFDTLADSGTSSVPPTGWIFEESGLGANTIYSADDGSNSVGDVYSLGSTGNNERAFGTLRTGSLIPTLGVRLMNNTGSTITSLDVSYTGETWRVGAAGRSDRLDFQISTDATSLLNGTWTDVDQLDYANPGQASGQGSLQHSANISHTITGLAIPAGATFYFRWSDWDVSGSDDSMGIDDFSVTANGGTAPEVQLYSNDLSANIANGTSIPIGNHPLSVQHFSFALQNTGSSPLTLGTVGVTSSTNATVNFTAQPAGTVAAAGSGTLTFDVTPDAAGAWSVTLSVATNDSDENPTTWTVSGTARTPFQSWADGINWSGGDSSAGGDPNHDGITNFESYALDIDPVAASGKRAKVLAGTDSVTAGGPWFTLTYRRSLTATGVVIGVQATSDLATPPVNLTIDGVNVIQEVANPDVDGDGSAELVRIRVKIPAGTGKRFFNLQFSES